jgi:flagellar biosynthesis GTPase FlhF
MNGPGLVEEKRAMNDTKTFRGRSLEEVLPQIKADLGPEAEIVRQREGLTGGVGGFFQRACIEVDARPGEQEEERVERRRFDAYDDEQPARYEPPSIAFEPPAAFDEPAAFEPDPLPDEATTEGLTAPGIQEIMRQAVPFADHLEVAARRVVPEPEPEPVHRWIPSPSRPQVADAIEASLIEAGIRSELVQELVASTLSHLLPFGSTRRLRKLVREALARRLPIAGPPAAGGRSLAFAGPGGSGKTICTARLAAAYAQGSDLPVVCMALRPPDGGAELRGLLEPLGVGVTVVESGEEARAHVAGALSHALVVVDTPAVSPGDAAEVGRLGADLETLALDEVHLALPSTYSGAVAAELTERLAPLRLTHVALTHMDETTRVGGLVDFVIAAERPLSYVSQGTEVPGGLEPADPLDIAALVLP